MKENYKGFEDDFISEILLNAIVDRELEENNLQIGDDKVIYIKDSIGFIDNMLFYGYKAGFLQNYKEKELEINNDDFLKMASDDLSQIFKSSIELNDIDDKGLNFVIKEDNLKSAIVEAFKIGKSSSIVKNINLDDIENSEFDDKFIGEEIVLLSPLLSNPRSNLKAGEKGVVVGVSGNQNDQKLYVKWKNGNNDSIIVNLDDFAIFQSKKLVRETPQEESPKRKWF